MEQALDLPLDAVTLERMTFGDGVLAGEPFEACCFPYAQHYLTTSFPASSPITDRDGLEQAVATLNAQARVGGLACRRVRPARVRWRSAQSRAPLPRASSLSSSCPPSGRNGQLPVTFMNQSSTGW